VKFDPKEHHRRSIRLKEYDYSRAGAYFVTIVTWQRECLFGEIEQGKMALNEIGEIVCEEWERTVMVRHNVELGEYVIMPNHVHGILSLVGATRRVAPTSQTLQPGSLGAIMAQFKSIVTKRINGLQNVSGRPVWQRNYYEHIIRNERDMDRITRYIEANPLRWTDDDENPNRPYDTVV
jgi:putative transposase